jgi:hypothetical protein
MTDTPTPENAAESGLRLTTCCGSSDTPETDAETLRATDIKCGGDFDAVRVQVSKRLERERDVARKHLSYQSQTVTIAAGTIQEQLHRIESLKADNLIYSTQRKKDQESNRRFAEAVTLLRNGGDGPETVARLREIILHNAGLSHGDESATPTTR